MPGDGDGALRRLGQRLAGELRDRLGARQVGDGEGGEFAEFLDLLAERVGVFE